MAVHTPQRAPQQAALTLHPCPYRCTGRCTDSSLGELCGRARAPALPPLRPAEHPCPFPQHPVPGYRTGCPAPPGCLPPGHRGQRPAHSRAGALLPGKALTPAARAPGTPLPCQVLQKILNSPEGSSPALAAVPCGHPSSDRRVLSLSRSFSAEPAAHASGPCLMPTPGRPRGVLGLPRGVFPDGSAGLCFAVPVARTYVVPDGAGRKGLSRTRARRVRVRASSLELRGRLAATVQPGSGRVGSCEDS